MTDYPCPPEIEKYFANSSVAKSVGRQLHFNWIRTLTLARGNRVEIFNFSEDRKEWWVYEPSN